MLRNFLTKASDAIDTATKSVSEAASSLKQLGDTLATRVANAADLGRMLDILDKVPGIDFEKREPDAAYLTVVMVAIQTSQLTLVITCSGKDTTDVDILRMRPLAAKDADALMGAASFGAMVLAEGEEGRPAIQMLVNKENLTRNYRHVTADALMAGLMMPIENIRVIGPVLARPLRSVVRPVAQFILDIIFTQAENLLQYTRAAKPVPSPSESSALPAPPVAEPAKQIDDLRNPAKNDGTTSPQ